MTRRAAPREAKAKGLRAGEPGGSNPMECPGQGKVRGRKPAEVHHAAEVQFKDLRLLGTKLDVVNVRTHLKGVVSLDPGEVVSPLKAALDAVLCREGLAAEEGEARDIHAQAAAAGKLGEAIVQAAARVLETRGVE